MQKECRQKARRKQRNGRANAIHGCLCNRPALFRKPLRNPAIIEAQADEQDRKKQERDADRKIVLRQNGRNQRGDHPYIETIAPDQFIDACAQMHTILRETAPFYNLVSLLLFFCIKEAIQ